MSATGQVILVIDDHDFQRHTIARMLKSLGASEVLEAENGEEALALLGNPALAQPTIVVCDLDMPQMDGMEFIRHLGKANSGLSVVIASALDSALLGSVEKMSRAYGVRLLGVIEKPLTLERLQDILARHQLLDTKPPRPATNTPAFTAEQILLGVQNKEMEPFFQPKVNLADGKIVGAEALARWRHPQHGIIGPYAFILPLERSMQIDTLTFLMLEKAARSCHAWREQEFDITVSVNLSLVSLTDTTLADRILQTVRTAGLDPRHMILEITETAAMTDIAPVLENLTRLRMRGFGLSIDDYGTGFSSMQQLTRVPFSELKIDQSFVTGCANIPSSMVIIESSLSVAKGLSIKSVAEGVETQNDWDALKSMGCDIAQGYFIAKPMEEVVFLEFCAKKIAPD